MGGCNSKWLRDGPIVGYAQTHSRSQTHEVAVIPLTVANFPSASCPAFTRLHEIYRTCPRVRSNFANSEDEALDCDAFFKRVVVDASHPNLANGVSTAVAVATRWRGDESWDISGFIGCRGYSSDGHLIEVNHIQMFFRDGHKVPLTMPAIQLAAKLFAEIHLGEATETDPTAKPTAAPWPTNMEWTIRRHNMEVRRVLEAVLVFWGLRPARSHIADPAWEYYRRLSPQALQLHAADPTAEHPPLSVFPLECRSTDDERITVGTNDKAAIGSLLSDLASWATGPARWLRAVVPSPGLEALLRPDFSTAGGRVLTTGLSMNFRGTQQKTPAERREILGATVADILELVQPKEGEGQPKRVKESRESPSVLSDGEVVPRGAQFPKAPPPFKSVPPHFAPRGAFQPPPMMPHHHGFHGMHPHMMQHHQHGMHPQAMMHAFGPSGAMPMPPLPPHMQQHMAMPPQPQPMMLVQQMDGSQILVPVQQMQGGQGPMIMMMQPSQMMPPPPQQAPNGGQPSWIFAQQPQQAQIAPQPMLFAMPGTGMMPPPGQPAESMPIQW